MENACENHACPIFLIKKEMMQFHPLEEKLLKHLTKVKKAKVDRISKDTGLDQGQVRKALAWLMEKGLVKETVRAHEIIALGRNGKKYLYKGLPEKRFLKLIQTRDESLQIIKNKLGVDEFNYSIGFLKRKGFISIINGKARITTLGRDFLREQSPEEMLLKLLKHDEYNFSGLPQEMQEAAKKLISRKNIIVVSEKIEREYEITNKGLKLKLIDKKLTGKLTPELIKSGKWGQFRSYNIKVPAPKLLIGKKHMLRQAIESVRQIWLELGFKEMKGPLLDAGFWNFDALYTPQDHPARTMHDTFYIKNPSKTKRLPTKVVKAVKETHENGWTTGSTGWGYKWDESEAMKNILRTHTTILSAKTLYKLRKDGWPAKYFSVGRCFRNETLDWKHTAEFYQVEGIVVGDEVNFRELLGYLKRFFSKMGFEKARFRPGYFPYTEMSTQIDVYHPVHKTWVELGGAGMFRPEVVKPLLGEDVPVLAWGPGYDRIINEYFGLNDIRIPYRNDLKILREARIWLR